MTDRDATFEQILADLESIADSLEREDLDLDQALTLFERGVEKLRIAGGMLDAAHGKVEELVEGAADSWEFRPLDADVEGRGEPGAD